jgi:hypothetical protein
MIYMSDPQELLGGLRRCLLAAGATHVLTTPTLFAAADADSGPGGPGGLPALRVVGLGGGGGGGFEL